MSEWSMSPGDFRYVFRSGLRLQVTPEGDCREATFTAKGEGVGLLPLNAVQISYDGTPIFYGEVRVGGNPHDVDGHQFTLRSLSLRLKEVTIPEGWSAPQQSASETVRSLIAAVLPQVGGAFSIGQITLPFDCRPIANAQQQNPYALLEQIASDGAGLGVKVRFGVNANREFFCVPAREDVTTLSGDMLTGQSRWTASVAETPCTAVLWYVARKPDGSWLTYLSQAPEASVYGLRVKPVSFSNDKGLWRKVDTSFSYWESDDAQNWTQADPAKKVDPKILADGEAGASSNVTFTKPYGRIRVHFQETPTRIVGTASVTWNFPNSDITYQDSALLAARQGDAISPPQWGSLTYYPFGWSPDLLDIYPFKRDPSLLSNGAKADKVTLSVSEARGEILDTRLLDRLAKFHYDIPATAPADLELRGFHPDRAGNVTLNGWQSPVDAWEYRLSADRGMCTGILAGQRDDPNKLAQAELIKARDQRAVIQAITGTT